jgi:hypothetical protein
LNQVEIFFSILCRRLLKHGIFTSEEDLAEQMLSFIKTYVSYSGHVSPGRPADCVPESAEDCLPRRERLP